MNFQFLEMPSTDLVCDICNKIFLYKTSLTRHMKSVHDRGRLDCKFCERKFNRKDTLQRHIKNIHNPIDESTNGELSAVEDSALNEKSTLEHNDNSSSMCDGSADIENNGKKKKNKRVRKNIRKTLSKCIECNIIFCYVQELRNHLKLKHNLNMDVEELRFSNMAAFKKWKHDTERQELSLYSLRHGSKKSKRGVRSEYYCHRSGRYYVKTKKKGLRQRMLKTTGSVKLGILCTSIIMCEERPDGVYVQYCPHHYGHGKEISFVQLSTEEQDAIQENVSKGALFEDLLEDIKDCQSSTDHFQIYLIQKRDARFISNAYAADEYNPGVGEVESVDRWIRQCCKMEISPILFYSLEDDEKLKESILLIIMTEYQKQILLSASKQVVCVDTLYRMNGGRFCLTVLFIMDEFNTAFPVAFCLSSKVNKAVILQFFTSIRECTGPLSFTYFMSNSEEFIYEAWTEVMEEAPKWLWNMWNVAKKIQVKCKVFRGCVAKKAEAYRTMRTLLECQNVNMFESIFRNYIEALNLNPSSRSLADFISRKYGETAHFWAYCHRKDIPLSTNIHLEVLHRIFQFCCREGRKKRLDKFLFVVMKLLRYKMLDRLSSILDEEKTELAIEAITICHNEGLEITSECITSLSDKIWLIQPEEEEQNIYVMREFETCPEHCNLRCSDCDVCVHMYTCSCIHSVINANMCAHIHAVVWKFLTPHFSPPPSPALDDVEELEDMDVSVIPDKCPELLEEILKKSHDVYKMIRENKCNLSNESLSAILKHLHQCIDIGRGKSASLPVINSSQNVINVVLPNNCKDLSEYVFVLQDNNVSKAVPEENMDH